MCIDKKYLNSISEWRIFNQYSLSHQVNKSYKSVYDKQVNFHEWAHKTIIFSMNKISPIHWYICAAQYMRVSLDCWQNFECFTFLKFENPSRESKVMQFFVLKRWWLTLSLSLSQGEQGVGYSYLTNKINWRKHNFQTTVQIFKL